MAKRKRKTSGRSTASRRKNRTQDRMPAGLITLFAGLVLMALAFVPGSSAWRTMHDVLFGVFGCGSFVLGAALCYLAILYTRGEDLLPHIAKLVLGLIFASGTVIVFSDIPTDQTAAQMTAACYHNGMSAWLSGGALGAVLGGTLLLLCGRPAANLVMAALAACASLYIFDVTPAECWQWLCNVGGSVHEKGLAVTSRMPPAGPSVWQNAPPRRPRQRNMRTMTTTCRKTKWAKARTAAAAKSLPRPPSISSLPAGWLASSTGAIR